MGGNKYDDDDFDDKCKFAYLVPAVLGPLWSQGPGWKYQGLHSVLVTQPLLLC